MRKKLLLMGLVMSVVAMAAPVTLQQAQQRAQQFMARRGTAHNMRLAKQQLRIEQAQQDNAYYYVFNVGEQQGFVIVSGDDRTPDILGYADSGSFSDQDMPDNMRAWLQGYEDQMRWLDEHPDLQKVSRKANSTRSSINPLITTMWDQGKPYDRETPIARYTRVTDQYGNYVRTDTTFCVTGCVATAMAQIMYYHHWPVDPTTSIPGYSDSGYDSEGSTLPSPSNDLPSTTFDWTKMRDTYTSANFAPELAKLMRYCGQAVQMHYSPGESGASTPNVISALKEYFNYDNTASYISRENYTAAQWADIIYAELQEERPVLYSGSSSGGGHAFIVDGYSEDEYYHINWGWSGRHNGYFLLSVLNPYANNESGASSSKDGYSFSQGAGIGIQQQKGTPLPAPVLSCMELTATSTNPTHYSNGFQIPYSYTYGNYSGFDGTFDIALGLFDEADNLLESSSPIGEGNTLKNSYYSWGSGSRMMGESLADGTYFVKMVYRITGSEDWLKTKDADLYAITAVVEGTSMVLTNAVQPTVELTATTISADGTPEVGSPTTLTTSITNSGTGLFNNYLYLFVDGSLAGGKMFEVESGETKTFSIEYIPTSAGTKDLKICTDNQGQNVIATGQINISGSGSDVTTDDIDLDITYDILNRSGDKIMGNNLQVVANITNNQDVNYSGNVYIYLYRKYSEGAYTYTGWQYVYRPFNVPAHSTTKFEYTFDLDYDKTYNVEVKYIKAGSEVTGAGMLDNYLTPVEAYILYTTDGEKTYGETAADISTNASVAFADLRGQSTVQNVTSVANPNTIFMLDEEASLSGATNVIKNGVADKIELTDGYGFYTPVAFTATNISLNHTADKAFASGSGWETITLPFDVDAVSVNDEEIDWFHSSTDKGKNFWVMEFSGDDSGTVNFDYANEMSAYTPYIFTVPGDNYAEKWNLKGKTLVFSGTNAQIKASSDARGTITGSSYKFVGTTSAKSNLTDIYKLNTEGSSFVKTDGSVESFRAYFAPTTYQYATDMLSIGIGGGTTTGIADMLPAQQMSVKSGVYNLNGVKVSDTLESLPAGIYIINGKKIVK